jgi:hypothetical protein
MTTAILLRTASVVSFLFAIGHSLGGLKQWSPIGDNDMLTAMRTYRFDTMGVNRSYLDFYLGFGWSLSVAMLLQSVLLWQLASQAGSHPARLRPMIAAFAIASLAGGIIAWQFILPVPALFSAALLIVLVAAYVRA